MTAKKFSQTSKEQGTDAYRKLDTIDGRHPIQDHAPGTYVPYRVRKRKNGRVCYLNFDLAKEMGILPKSHPLKLNPQLNKKLLDTFSLIIINEFDIINNKKFPESEIKPNMYMATRYLQMQHKSKIGLTSGDGRGIWNGYVQNGGQTWDVTSCGTGATCLSPASANNNKFYESGDPSVSYGCGFAESMEAVGNSVFSEILHQNGVPTERTLCIIEYPGDFCIIVRAGKNLIRPSHFFNHLKQGRYNRLKSMFDLFIERQAANGFFQDAKKPIRQRYDSALKSIAEQYAKSCAIFEREYIFCWLDWDGDNMLADGGIIDYGSIRQLGLYHHDYRFDDDERWSTNLREQRQKGRYITQTFIQLVDFLKTGVRKNRSKFDKHPILKHFDSVFEEEKKRLLLRKMGMPQSVMDHLLKRCKPLVTDFQNTYDKIERWTSEEGLIEVPDGVTRNAVYNMRQALFKYPLMLKEAKNTVESESFFSAFTSGYATKDDRKLTKTKDKHAKDFQIYYVKLLKAAAKFLDVSYSELLSEVIERSGKINNYERVTGDAMFYVGKALYGKRNQINSAHWHSVIRAFVQSQKVDYSESFESNNEVTDLKRDDLKKLLKRLLKIVSDFKEGL